MDKLADKGQKLATIPGFELERNPDDNTFVDFNDGAVPKKNIKDMTKEELREYLKGKTYSIEESGGCVTLAVGEGGDGTTTKGMTEEGDSADILNKMKEYIDIYKSEFE